MHKSTEFLLTKFIIFCAVIFMIVPSPLLAQMQEIPLHRDEYKLSSGIYIGDQTGDKLVFTGVINSPGAPWLSIHFSTFNLGENSYMILTSLYDGKWQRHNNTTLTQWYNYSAFFNGDAVKIELYASPGDRDIYFNVDELVVGDEFSPGDSQCGPTDDRIASSDPAVGRIVNIGCTGWIIPDGDIVTAGHCLDATSANILEFNVPLSNSNGTINHPGPEDQYSIDQSSRIFINGGIGNDFGVCKVFPNSVTGLMPKEAQQAYFNLVQDLTVDPIRITGYGVDDGTANQTQQTNSGPNAGSSGTALHYVVDTEGGNSGSPVIDENTHSAVGVHTHGGCNYSGGYNSGTSLFHTAFWDAVNYGLPVPVELTSLRADVNNGAVTLNWVTATETNNNGFEVQRNSGSGYQRLAFIQGNGTSNQPHTYSYTDNSVTTQKYYYRLRQVDLDGSSEYSKVVEVEVKAPMEYSLAQNYPNPFNPTTNINFSLAVDSKVTLKIFDVLGQEVATLLNRQIAASRQEVTFDASRLNSGVYFYRLEAKGIDGSGFTSVKKMILAK